MDKEELRMHLEQMPDDTRVVICHVLARQQNSEQTQKQTNEVLKNLSNNLKDYMVKMDKKVDDLHRLDYERLSSMISDKLNPVINTVNKHDECLYGGEKEEGLTKAMSYVKGKLSTLVWIVSIGFTAFFTIMVALLAVLVV